MAVCVIQACPAPTTQDEAHETDHHRVQGFARQGRWAGPRYARALGARGSRIILTHTNAEVRDLNIAARDKLRDGGELGSDVDVKTERGSRDFASGDRMMFLRNERGMGVKNGTLARLRLSRPDTWPLAATTGAAYRST